MVNKATTQTAATLAQTLQSSSKHDIVNCLLGMVLAELPPDTPLGATQLAAINQKIRLQWGGARITVHPHNPIDIDHRRDSICELYVRGAQIRYLANKFELSESRIKQIIKDRRS